MAGYEIKLIKLLNDWEESSGDNKTEFSHKILESAENLLNSSEVSNNSESTLYRYLNITGDKDYISSLKDRESRYIWANTTTKAIHLSGYDLIDMFENQVSRQPKDLQLLQSHPHQHKVCPRHRKLLI